MAGSTNYPERAETNRHIVDVDPSCQNLPSTMDGAGTHVDAPLILVVDDIEDTRLLYGRELEEAGYRVEQANNGQEALEIIGQKRPALVLMDLSMPVMDGWEATKRIKGHPTTADVIVIAVTGHSTHLGMMLAADAGAEVVLSKPCLPADVITHVRRLVGPPRDV